MPRAPRRFGGKTAGTPTSPSPAHHSREPAALDRRTRIAARFRRAALPHPSAATSAVRRLPPAGVRQPTVLSPADGRQPRVLSNVRVAIDKDSRAGGSPPAVQSQSWHPPLNHAFIGRSPKDPPRQLLSTT